MTLEEEVNALRKRVDDLETPLKAVEKVAGDLDKKDPFKKWPTRGDFPPTWYLEVREP